MASITTIDASDLISDSRTDINTNFSNLNSDKIETSYLDTDTTLAANSDSKIATQKATREFVLANVNPTGASWNEYAADAGSTDAYVISLSGVSTYTTGQTFKFKANTANTGACTLKVNSLSAITIKKNVTEDLATGDILANQQVVVIYDGTNMQMVSQRAGLADDSDITALSGAKTYTVGALDNATVKTFFNMQLPFIIATGEVDGDTATNFAHWTRGSTDVAIPRGGMFARFTSTGVDHIEMDSICNGAFGVDLNFLNSTNIIVLDLNLRVGTISGDIGFGFAEDSGACRDVYDANARRVMFHIQDTGDVLWARLGDGTTDSGTDISSGITLTNWNNYRIEADLGANSASFYVNGTLKATLTTNFPVTNSDGTIAITIGRNTDSTFEVTAPNFAIEMNP